MKMNCVIEYLIKHSSEIASALATLIAAFAGSWFAFKLQRNYEIKEITDQNLNAYNMSFIRIFHQYNDLLLVKKNFISSIENDPIKWLNIPALSTQNKLPDPDLVTLSFVIEYNMSSLLSEIIIANQKYDNCLNIVNIRSDIHLNRLQPIIEKSASISKFIDQETIIRELGPKLIGELQNLTNEIETMLPEILKYYETLLCKMTENGKILFPKRRILSYKTIETKYVNHV
jgi:hypothetical protein